MQVLLRQKNIFNEFFYRRFYYGKEKNFFINVDCVGSWNLYRCKFFLLGG